VSLCPSALWSRIGLFYQVCVYGRICKDAVVLYLKALSCIPLERLRKCTQNSRVASSDTCNISFIQYVPSARNVKLSRYTPWWRVGGEEV
jgi:hypothetical protein